MFQLSARESIKLEACKFPEIREQANRSSTCSLIVRIEKRTARARFTRPRIPGMPMSKRSPGRQSFNWPSTMFFVHSSRVGAPFVHSRNSLPLLRRGFLDDLFLLPSDSGSVAVSSDVAFANDSSRTSSLLSTILHERALACDSIRGIGESGSSRETIVRNGGLSFRILSSQDL